MSAPLCELLQREIAAVERYIDLLDQEAQALLAGRFLDLAELADHKAEAARQVAAAGRAREDGQVACGHGLGRTGAEAACAAAGADAQQAWQALQQRATQARERNLRNGAMIHTHLDFTRQTLGFLKAAAQPLYGPNGMQQGAVGCGGSLACG